MLRRARDAITDVPGVRVGHWTDRRGVTGCTVVLCPPEGAVAACAVLGGAPGTRETDALAAGNLVQHVHAVLLTGGSAFGLDAASGVMRWLAERGIGFPTRAGPVPIVPAAVLFDLGVGRADAHPDAAAGYDACMAAGVAVRQGSAGAGTGATVAKLAGLERAVKGGLGTASERLTSGGVIGAIVAVNAVGEIVDPETGRIVAGMRLRAGAPRTALDLLRVRRIETSLFENTTIAVVATDVRLDRGALYRVALMAHAGIARTVRPSHSPADGDTVFALSTGSRVEERPDLLALGALAARALERAVLKAVRHATTLAGIPAACQAPRVRPVIDADRESVEAFITREWGAPELVSCGRVHRPAELDGFLAELEGAITGLVMLQVEGERCEVVMIKSIVDHAGCDRALMAAAEGYARAHGCRRLWLVTTNDNLPALSFSQRMGMRIAAVRPGAVEAARRRKPEIPLTGYGGIPIRDEIELEKEL